MFMEYGIVMELYVRRVVGRRPRAAMVSCNAVVRAEEPGTREGHRNGQGFAARDEAGLLTHRAVGDVTQRAVRAAQQLIGRRLHCGLIPLLAVP